MSNGLDPDQDQLSVDPILGPNCLHRLSADYKGCLQQETVNLFDPNSYLCQGSYRQDCVIFKDF